MEEIEVLKSVALDKYLTEDKYCQVEDLLAVCIVNLSASLNGILQAIFDVRGTGKNPNLKEVAADLQNIVQHIAVMSHCFDLNIPELEQIEEFVEEEFESDNKLDVTMCILSIQHIYTQMIRDYYVDAFEEKEEDLVDVEMMQIGIIDMLASTLCICTRYKMDFSKVVIYG